MLEEGTRFEGAAPDPCHPAKLVPSAPRRTTKKFKTHRLSHGLVECRSREKVEVPAIRLPDDVLEAAAAERWFTDLRSSILESKARKRETQTRRAELERTAYGWHTDAEFNLLVWLFQNRCAYCWEDSRLTEDHVIPLIAGGGHNIENILPACRRCNSKKGGKRS